MFSLLFFAFSYSGGWHIPEEILSGNFRGNYTFSGNVEINNISLGDELLETGVISASMPNDMSYNSGGEVNSNFVTLKKGFIFIIFMVV